MYEGNQLGKINIKNSPKYKEVRNCFEQLFRLKNYRQDSKFDKNVWFMQTDEVFQSMIRPNYIVTPSSNVESNKMYLLLKDLSKTNDFGKLSIEVSAFIDRITEILLRSQELLDRSIQSINDYDAYKNSISIFCFYITMLLIVN